MLFSDFTVDLTQFSIRVLDQKRFKGLLLGLLKTASCPMVFEIQKEGADAASLSRSRDLLQILGWLIHASGAFERYYQNFIAKIARELEFNEELISEEDETPSTDDFDPQNRDPSPSPDPDENDLIELVSKLRKAFSRLFDLFSYYEKTRLRLHSELSLQKLGFRLSELFLMKSESKLQKLIERMIQVTNELERQKENLKHEELFWLWMESVVDLDKKEMINDPAYGFSEFTREKPSSYRPNKGIEGLFGELKALNGRFLEVKDKFKAFQALWAKRKEQLNGNRGLLDQLKNDSAKLLADFDKRFLSLEKVQGKLQSNPPDAIFAGEIIGLFPVKRETGCKKESEEEIESARKILAEEEKELKEKIREKIKGVMENLKSEFVIYNELE